MPSLALGETAAEDLAFRLAVEIDGAGRVDRVVFLALRGEDRVECFWPMPLELPTETGLSAAVQLRLIADDGYAGPEATTSPPTPRPALQPRRRASSARPRPPATLL